MESEVNVNVYIAYEDEIIGKTLATLVCHDLRIIV